MFSRVIPVVALSLVTASSLAGPDINIHLNDDAVKIEAEGSVSAKAENLFNAAYHYSENDGSLISLGAYTAHANDKGDFLLGVKYVGMDPKSDSNTHMLALSGGYGLAVAPNTKLSARASFAPSVLVSGDFDRYVDLDINLNYQLMPKANVMLGYKAARIDHESGEHGYFDKSLYLGVKFKF